jgi:ABC-type Mn2+/Zn2+ transport system permease subunit
VGVVFSVALAAGSMITSGEDLIEALFGGGQALTRGDLWFGLAIAAVIVGFTLRRKHALVLALVSPDIARTVGIDIRRLNLFYLEMFALTIALGLRYLGVLLMGSLIIIPAATAKRLARTLDQMLLIAVLCAVAATAGGIWLAAWTHRDTGPVIVCLAAAGFVLSFARRL